MTTGVASVTAKLVAQPADMPQMTLLEWTGLVLAIVIGLVTGEVLGKRIHPDAARRLIIFLAFAGALIATGRGTWQITGS